MIWRDTSKSYAELVVGPAGEVRWTRIFTCQLGPLKAGDALTVYGQLQGARSNDFDVEYRIALEVADGAPASSRTTNPSQHPLTGENIGPSTSDKYVCLSHLLEFDLPADFSDAYATLWAAARSTAATASTRQSLSNGYLSVRKHAS